jgi:hypothetical protein
VSSVLLSVYGNKASTEEPDPDIPTIPTEKSRCRDRQGGAQRKKIMVGFAKMEYQFLRIKTNEKSKIGTEKAK